MDPRTPSEVEATGTLPSVARARASHRGRAGGARRRTPGLGRRGPLGLTVPGKYLAYEDAGRRVVAPVSREWTRIGRSLSADIRFDDATVSRRHALVVNQADGVRVLDDRSLNGVYVNGERVDWAPLTDGAEIAIGRHTIHYFDTATVGSGDSPPAAVAE